MGLALLDLQFFLKNGGSNALGSALQIKRLYTEQLAHSSHSKPFLKSNFSKLLKLSIFFNYQASFFLLIGSLLMEIFIKVR